MKESHFLVRQESGKEVSALAGLRPSFRFQRNRAGRSHAGRVLLRAQNSLRSFRGPARKPGPCRACARHFAFSETGQAGHTLRVCCFAPKIRCAHFGAPLANPALAGLRPSFRFQRNRAGRSHAARVLLRAQNSLRSFWGPARKPGPCRASPVISLSAKPGRPVTRCACVASRPKFAALILGPRSQTRPLPGFARHFAFSETGQAGHTLRVCCFAPKIRCAHFGAPLANPALAGLRPSFRFQRNRAGRSHAARVLLRAQNSLRSFWGPARKPGTFRSAKKHKFQRQQLANLCFFTRHSDGPGTQPAAQEPGLRPVGLGTRLRAQNGKRGGVFRRARNSKNDIRALTRCACAGKRDLE